METRQESCTFVSLAKLGSAVAEGFLVCHKKILCSMNALHGDVAAGGGSCKRWEGNCVRFAQVIQEKVLVWVYILEIRKHSRKVLALFPVWVHYVGESILQ